MADWQIRQAGIDGVVVTRSLKSTESGAGAPGGGPDAAAAGVDEEAPPSPEPAVAFGKLGR